MPRLVIAVDGGGIRGLIPAMVLARIEELAGRPVAAGADLIAGTSTGGIIALALARPDPVPASRIVELYRDQGPAIFRRRTLSMGGLAGPRYNGGALERTLAPYLGDYRLGQAACPVMVTGYDIEHRDVVVWKSWRDEFRGTRLLDAALGTSAAPTYFPPALVVAGGVRAVIDGGVALNNPAAAALHEARRLWPQDQIIVASFGTGQVTRRISWHRARRWGLLCWAAAILSCVMDAQSRATEYWLRHDPSVRYLRFQLELHEASDDLDDASPANIEALTREAARLIEWREADLRDIAGLIAR